MSFFPWHMIVLARCRYLGNLHGQQRSGRTVWCRHGLRSTSSTASSDSRQRGLKTTRIGQLIDTLNSEIHKPPADKSEWGGMEMFLNQQVRDDDPRMSAVYDHFSRNLWTYQDRQARRCGNCCQHRGGDLKVPRRSARSIAGFGRSGQTQMGKVLSTSVAAQTAGKIEEAAEWFREAAQIDDQFADLAFREGCWRAGARKTADAHGHFAARAIWTPCDFVATAVEWLDPAGGFQLRRSAGCLGGCRTRFCQN